MSAYDYSPEGPDYRREPWFLRTWVIGAVYAVAIIGVIAVTVCASIVGGVS